MKFPALANHTVGARLIIITTTYAETPSATITNKEFFAFFYVLIALVATHIVSHLTPPIFLKD